jgi:hypothetical protein
LTGAASGTGEHNIRREEVKRYGDNEPSNRTESNKLNQPWQEQIDFLDASIPAATLNLGLLSSPGALEDFVETRSQPKVVVAHIEAFYRVNWR